jgi:6,7-dimethyl-8-ribityllumazine synthase
VPKVIEGKRDAREMKFGIIVSRFNSFVTEKLLAGALDAFKRHDGREDKIDVVWVPGAFEIPFFAEKMAASGRYDALVCLGAVIRGDTPHFEYICTEAVRGISQAMVQHRVPIGFGILTTNNAEQALQRAGPDTDNKGFEATVTAIEMASLNRLIA